MNRGLRFSVYKMKPDLPDRFTRFCQSQELFQPEDQIVVAISGGGDSLALVDLFSQMRQPIVLAHCNFNLRGSESDEDEEFVRKVALVYDLPLHVVSFDTEAIARERGLSVEMAARDLRYSWFEEIRMETSSASIAVAHHSDDSMETMLINLIRGTGLRGLTGIRPKQGRLIRPLLFTSRSEIIDYLESRHLEYREDSSNSDTRIIRNRIRHLVLPEFEKINPGIRQTLRDEQYFFSQAQKIIDNYIHLRTGDLTMREDGRMKISLTGLLKEEFPETVLFELLKPFGFHSRQVGQILAAACNGPGKLFSGKGHSLLIDREYMIISPMTGNIAERYYFDPESPDPDLPLDIESRIITGVNFFPESDRDVACLDYDKLDLPLIVRRWEKGDYFFPLGMDHPKKVSDFFIDRKVNRMDKEMVWILASGEQIVWVVGHRIDHRFRVTENTREVLELRVI